MKNIKTCAALFLLLIIALPLQLQAQPLPIQERDPIRWGVKGGLTFGDYYNAPIDFAVNDEFMAGAFINYRPPAFPVTVQTEVLYTRKGVARFNREIITEYIEVPLLAKKQLIAPGSIEVIGYGGPMISFPLKSIEKLRQLEDRELSPNTDYGGTIGIEVLLPIGNKYILFDGRYGLGLNNVVQEFNSKSSVFYFSAGISF